MGLDQYAAIRLDTKDEEGNWEQEELAYWRKHPHLQGFMEHLYAEKGGEGEFNCVDVELTLEDIDDLEASVKGGELPETGGFFFGDDSSDYYKESDLEFCENARKALTDGQTVVYSSWW
jgi:hypothetical protein